LAGVFAQAVSAFVVIGSAVATFAGAEPSAQAPSLVAPSLVAPGLADPVSQSPTSTHPAESVQSSESTLNAISRWAAPALEAAGIRSPKPADSKSAETVPVAALPAAPPAPVVAAAPAAVAPPSEPAVTKVQPVDTAKSEPAAAEHDAGGTAGLRPAKELFGAVKTPVNISARAIGTYAKGCLAGGQALPVDGPAWQAMRLSRNRNWGHPKLIAMVQKLATDGKAKDGWLGLLVGDIAQPRGGPMLTGHASHQIGLDADIWLTPMPDRRLSTKEREDIEATSMLSEDGMSVSRERWTESHLNIIKRAASYPEVERVLVHPAIKQVLCFAAGTDRSWLTKVRPYWGHHYHFHVRIGCPSGSDDCAPQKSVPGDDGCDKELEEWLNIVAKAKPEPSPIPIPPVAQAKPSKEPPPVTLDKLPSQCRVVLATGNPAATKDVALAAAVAAKAATARDGAAAKGPTGTTPSAPAALGGPTTKSGTPNSALTDKSKSASAKSTAEKKTVKP
jgi:penicillin-insensitive murein DD-endopeptidase